MWCPRVSLLALLLHVGAALGLKNDCPQPCISIAQCPELITSIRTNAAAVLEATCEFTASSVPKVCCPSPVSSREPHAQVTRTRNPLLPKRCGESAFLDTRVFGGTSARLGKYPWMAALGFEDSVTRKIEFLCGGSVISEQYILTAAHCLDTDLAVVRLADWNLESDIDCQTGPSGTKVCNSDAAQDLKYEEIIKHPDYKKRGLFSDDIALIRLASPITFGEFIQPVCLPDRDFDVGAALGGRRAIVAGWGFTESLATSDVLLEVSLPHVEMATCNETFKGRLVGKQLCFGGISGQDSCGGDSGGPVVMLDVNSPPYTQIGIVSFGSRHCGRTGVPGVYASVSSYRDWIDQNMRPQHEVKPPTSNPLLPKSCGESFVDTMIVGGSRTRLGKYPWMAVLGYESRNKTIEFRCSGSVISERYILTAATCLGNDPSINDPTVIRLAEWDLSSATDCETGPSGTRLCNTDPAQDFELEEIIKHPGYQTGKSVSDDIALIRLARSITFNQWIQPVCLPKRDLDVGAALSGRRAIVAGWGRTDQHGDPSDVLLEVSLPYVGLTTCNETYSGILKSGQLCFGGVSGEDSCIGDSGGPLVMSEANAPPYTQIGIVSLGFGCGIRPGVYTSVPSYRDWIDQNMRP